MLSTTFKRNKARVDAAYKQVGTTLIALEPLKVYFPERFVERDLAKIEDVCYVLGFFAVVTEDNYYASSMVTAMMRMEPDRIGKAVIDDVPYIEFQFNKGSKFIASTDVVMNDNLPHRVYTELYSKARVPWYYDYDDIPAFFVNTRKYNGVRTADDPAIWEYIGAAMCRDPDDPTRYYRQRPTVRSDIKTKPPYYVALRNVSYGANNVVSKLSGSYFDDGVTSALTNPSDREERIETMLRQ